MSDEWPTWIVRSDVDLVNSFQEFWASLFTRTTILRPFTWYEEPENVFSVPRSAMSDGLGREVSTALAHCLPGIIGTAMSRDSQYMFIIT